MMLLATIALSTVLPLAGLQSPQRDPPRPDGEPAPAEAVDDRRSKAAPVVAAWDDRTAKRALAEFRRAMAGKPDLLARAAALEPLALGSHPSLVRPLFRLALDDDAVAIQRRAIALLANQPERAASRALLDLLGTARVRASAPVLADLVQAFARCGYEPGRWSKLEDLFEHSFEAEWLPVQRALLDLIAHHGEAQAVPLLLRHLDEPIPVDVDHPDNPPESYWKARWLAWEVFREPVREALFAITGQRFASRKEAETWLAANPLR
ncbi:MAG: hypothetical protein AB7O97_10775 [Planctomycetota bacterium]